jgi:phosphate uptake regulator
MDVRKLISFGKGTFIVSMPKQWVEKNNLKKGDLISIDDDGHQLLISASRDGSKTAQKDIEIDAEDKSIDLIRAEIVSSYLGGYDSIAIRFSQDFRQAQQVKEILRNLSGMEIMEQTSTKISARNLISLNEISLPNMIRRMDVITRAMMEDAILCCRGQNLSESIAQRDTDLNRIFYLGYRTIKAAMKAPRTAKMLNTEPWQLHSDAQMMIRLEKLADRQKRIAKFLSDSGLDREAMAGIEKTYSEINEAYNMIMKAYYSSDKKIAYSIEVSSKKRIAQCDLLLERYANRHVSKSKADNAKLIHFVKIINNLKGTEASISNIARTVLSY